MIDTDNILQAVALRRDRIHSVYKRHEKLIPAGIFLCGMIFDTVTLGRIDDWFNIVSLGAYLMIVSALIAVDILDEQRGLAVSGIWARAWPYRHDVLHFLLGGLLSAFTLFFFKSSSIWGAALFFCIIVAALIGNEFSLSRNRGLVIRSALFAICLASYSACIVPVVWGRIGFWPFVVSWLVAAAMLVLLTWPLYRWGGNPAVPLRRFAAPAGVVLGVFLALYLLKIIPPVPLSLTHIGIYHAVERSANVYTVKHQKPEWKFWHTGDQDFSYRPGDRVYCFFSVFSPVGFEDKINARWLYYDAEEGWKTVGLTPVGIKGGRVQGYRGYSYKQNIRPGDWQVRIETSDGREIGRIRLAVETDDAGGGRTFRTESM